MGVGGRVRCERWTPVGVMVMTNVGMGLVNVVIKKTLDGGINHMVVATYRLAISAIFLSPFALLLERRTRPKLTMRLFGQQFISALLGASAVQYFCLLGLTYTSATVACAFISMIPATTFALALILRAETLNLKNKEGIAKLVGTLTCISGALLLTFYKGIPISNLHVQREAHHHSDRDHGHNSKRNKTAEYWLLGCLFNFLSDMFMSGWLLFQARINVSFPCKYSSTVLMSTFATFQCALLSLIKTRHIQGWSLSDKFDIFAVIYAGVVGQGISTAASAWCIKKRGALFTSSFYPIMLISATLFDHLILHRQLFLSSIIGSIIVVLGLYIFLWGKHKDLEGASNQLPLPTQTESRLRPLTDIESRHNNK